jgi:hypothetical protein
MGYLGPAERKIFHFRVTHSRMSLSGLGTDITESSLPPAENQRRIEVLMVPMAKNGVFSNSHNPVLENNPNNNTNKHFLVTFGATTPPPCP